MLISGLGLVAAFPLAAIYQDEYWSPVRLWGGRVGLEDIVFTFSLGSLVWLAAAWPFRGRLTFRVKAATFLRRYAASFAVGLAVMTVLWLIGLGAMPAGIIANVFITMVLLNVRRDLWRLSLSAALIVTPWYCGLLYVASFLLPTFFSMWNPDSLWGARIFGLPLEEVVWVATFSAAYSHVVAYAIDARLTSVDAATGRMSAQS